MAFRVSFFWKQQVALEGGWSENFWNNGSDYGAVLTRALDLRTAMIAVKGNSPFCPRFRISDPAIFRSGKNTRIAGAAPGPNLAADFSADYPTTKWLLKLTGSTATVNQWFGGIRDESVNQGGFLNRANPSVSQQFPAFAALLTNPALGWSVRVLNPAVLPIPILGINPTTGLVTVSAHNYLNDQVVRISRVRGLTEANGLWRVIIPPSSTTTFTLAGWVPSEQVYTKSPAANVRLQTYIFQPISLAQIDRATSHKVGRPTELLGGRRKTRRR